jgi:hypothetical protein
MIIDSIRFRVLRSLFFFHKLAHAVLLPFSPSTLPLPSSPSPRFLTHRPPGPKPPPKKKTKKPKKRTSASIQVLNALSSIAHPGALYPDDAQQLSIEVMMPTHGFASGWLRRRTRRRGRGGRRGGSGVVLVRGRGIDGSTLPCCLLSGGGSVGG